MTATDAPAESGDVLRAWRFTLDLAKVLWSPAYFAVSETTVRRYIEHQWDAVSAS